MSHPILLIGGNSGIGLATANLLHNQGRPFLAATRSSDALEKMGVPTLPFDASEPDLPADSLPETLSGLIYFPGSINLKPFHRLTAADFENDLRLNLFGAIHAIQAALPALKRAEDASIVLFSTVAVAQGMPFHASVAAAKGAVEGLARSLAAEFAPHVRVNLIAPSLTDTPLASALLSSDEKRDASAKRHPLQRIGTPEDCARLAVFLLSGDSKFITGQTFRPDGGLSAIRLFA